MNLLQTSQWNRWFFLFIASLIAWGSIACGIKAPDSASEPGRVTNRTACSLPSDQGNASLQGRWSSLPVPLVLDRDFYTSDEGAQAVQIRLAVNTWNEWARLRGKVAFTILNDGSGLGSGAAIPVTTDCSQPLITSARTDAVGIWKIQAGGDGRNERTSGNNKPCKLLPDGIQGLTDWTANNGFFTGASVLLNFDEYNNGTKVLDVQSLALHELGHVLGLLHSCKLGDDRTTAPNCDGAPFRYLEAVMYPSLGDNQIRRTLMQNDYSRVNCLY